MAIAKLSIDFEARLAQFESELKRISSVADSVSGKLTGAFKGVALAASGLAGITGFAALQAKVGDAIAGMAELKDAAERTGASVENLSALKGVAKIGGRDFGEIEAAVVKLNKALHATDDESKGAGKALAAIGLDIQKLREMDPAAAMLDIAKAFDSVEEGGGKSAAAVAIFGKAGAQLLPFLKDLAEKGSLVGKVTKEQAELADEYEKNVARLNATFGETSKTLAVAVLPTLNEFTQQLLDGIKYAGGFWSALGAGATLNPFKTTSENLKTVRADLEEMERISREEGYTDEKAMARKRAQLEMLKAQQRREALAGNPDANKDANDRKFERKINLNDQTFGPDPKVSEKVSDAQSIIKSLNEQIAVKQLDLETTGRLTEGERIRAKANADIEAGLIKVTKAERLQIDAQAAKLTAIERSLMQQNALEKAADDEHMRTVRRLDDLDEEVRRSERQLEMYGFTEAQVSAVTQARLEEALAIARQKENNEEEIATLERELAARERLTDALSGIDRRRQEIDEFNDSTRKGADAARELGMSFTSAFEDAVIGGKKAIEVVQALGQDVARIFLRKTVTEPLANTASDLFGDFFKSLKANATGGVYNSPSLSAYSGGVYNSPRLFAFASGAGVFGEAGPEAIMPLKRGPDGKLGVQASGSSAGQTSVTINVDASGTKTSGDSGAARELGRRIEAAVRNVIMVEQRPGGMLA